MFTVNFDIVIIDSTRTISTSLFTNTPPKFALVLC